METSKKQKNPYHFSVRFCSSTMLRQKQ